jgi:hypothetical protein
LLVLGLLLLLVRLLLMLLGLLLLLLPLLLGLLPLLLLLLLLLTDLPYVPRHAHLGIHSHVQCSHSNADGHAILTELRLAGDPPDLARGLAIDKLRVIRIDGLLVAEELVVELHLVALVWTEHGLLGLGRELRLLLAGLAVESEHGLGVRRHLGATDVHRRGRRGGRGVGVVLVAVGVVLVAVGVLLVAVLVAVVADSRVGRRPQWSAN